MSAKPRVLVVEDDPALLSQIQSEFSTLRNLWQLDYSAGSEEAQHAIQASPPYDAVVVDIAMDANEALHIFQGVAAKSPRTVRFALSDRANEQGIMRSASIAHQFVYSPCESHTLRTQVTRALELREKLQACPLRHKLHSVNALPPLPRLYSDVMRASEPASRRMSR